MVWIHGPPGSGKTTLLSTWLARDRRTRAIWIRLDPSGEDLPGLLRQLATAAAPLARRTIPLPAIAPSRGDDIGAAERSFFGALFATLPKRFVIVLDDFPAAGVSSPLAGALRAAAGELPPGALLAVAAQGAPPSSLARLRAHGDLATIGATALAVTSAEATALARSLAAGTPRSAVEAIRRDMHGWMTGIVLALAKGPNGAHGPLAKADAFEYFAGEVLDRLGQEDRQLLLEASLLHHPTPGLLAEATGIPSAGERIAHVARQGLFVFADGGEAPRFEFQPLFSEFLRSRAARELRPGRADEVRRRAAAALAGSGPDGLDEALRLLDEAGAAAESAALLKGTAAGMVAAGRGARLAHWLARLPGSVVEADPWLVLWGATTRAPLDPGEAVAAADRALERFEAAGDAAGIWLAWSVASEAILLSWSDFSGFARRIAQLERFMQLHPFPSPEGSAPRRARRARRVRAPRPEPPARRPVRGRGPGRGPLARSALAPAPRRRRLDARLRLVVRRPGPGAPGDRGARARRPLPVHGRGVRDELAHLLVLLAERLWPEADGDAAHHALETTLYRLRRLVGGATIVQRSGSISVDASRCWVDLRELEDRLDRIRARARAGGGADLAAFDLSRAAALLTGPAFVTDPSAGWAEEARARLRGRLARTLGALSSARMANLEVAGLFDRVAEVEPGALPSAAR